MKNNCKDCKERYFGCHDHCENYAVVKHEREEVKRKYRLDKLKYGTPFYSGLYTSV